jgi:transcriptional regulator with XRE-family HTH domain
MDFKSKLRRLRAKAGLSQAGLSEKAGIPIRSIQNWEQGHRKPRIEVVLNLARALGVAAEEILPSRERPGRDNNRT